MKDMIESISICGMIMATAIVILFLILGRCADSSASYYAARDKCIADGASWVEHGESSDCLFLRVPTDHK